RGCGAAVHPDVRAGQRPGGGGRGLGRRDPRPRPAVSAALSGLLPHGRGARRPRPRLGRVLRGTRHRRAGLRAEVQLPAGRHGVHLRPHARLPAGAPARAVRQARMSLGAAAQEYATRHRLRAWETLPWAAGLAVFFLFPNHLAFGTQVLITILFALSLDLVLGYAGIVTLCRAG